MATSITDLPPDLPPELMRGIIRYVRPKSVLCRLALCSRHMYRLVMSFLYEHIELIGEPFSLKSLTCLFLRRPDLAQHVRRFTSRGDCFGKSRDSNESSEMNEILKKAIKASSSRKEEEEQWLMDIDKGDAVMALLLPSLVKLEVLDVELPEDDMYHFIQMFKKARRREKPFDTKPAFPHLRDFIHSFDVPPDDYGYSPRWLFLFMLLPAIRGAFGQRLSSKVPEMVGSVYDVFQPLSASSPLSHIELEDCNLTDKDLIRLLEAPKALKTLIYRLGESYCILKADEIRDAITPQEDFMENLWLECKDLEPTDNMPLMRSFSSFKCLKILRIEAEYLLRARKRTDVAYSVDQNSRRDLIDIFPRTLQILEIIRCNDLVHRALEELMFHKNAQVPNLVELVLAGLAMEPEKLKDKFAKLAEITQSENVSLSYRDISSIPTLPVWSETSRE